VQNEAWGPYRIEERLGTGGMGEVYRAYDSRLDRWVALKIIRPDANASRKARDRFRREARSAASLSHPTVLQIFDIIERDDGDGIVMELVEGETLGRLLKRGPLELDRALRLAREIAEGLAAAHAREIIHRDLKAENVMITPDDHPKILDFGLAKRIGLTDEQSISIEGRVVGTSHAMSPEQAQGFEVDHRSDLFSFGTLLYEMVTGKSPFRRPALAETLTRVCVHRQTPVEDLRPEVPTELSELIDSVLQKKPDDRPQNAKEVVLALRQMEPAVSATINPISYPTMVDMPRATATGSMVSIPATGSAEASRTRTLPGDRGTESLWYRTVTLVRRPMAWGSALAVLAVATISLTVLRPSPPPTITVAVTAPEITDAGRVPEIELVRSGLRLAAVQAILDREGVFALATDRVDTVTGTSEEVAAATASEEVLASELRCEEVRCRVTISRVTARGAILGVEGFDVPTDDLLLMSQTMTNRVSQLYGEYPTRSGVDRLQVRPEDYEDFLRVRETFLRRPEEVTLEDLLDRVDRIAERSPRFAPIHLLKAEIARTYFNTTRERSDLERALTAIGTAREIAPEDPRPLYSQVVVALDSDRLEVAEAAIDDLERVRPGDPRILALRAILLEKRNQPGEALELLEAAVRQRPSVSNLFDLANMESRHGRFDAARSHLEELLERFPGSFNARKLLANIELQNGSAERAAGLYRELLEISPDADLLTNLSVAFLLLGQYEDAAATFERLRERQPNSAIVTLNLADAKLLAGQQEEARELYRQVIELVDRDPAGEDPVQFLTMKAQAYAHLGESHAAARLIQEALQTASESTQVAYEAAVTYAVMGETFTASTNAERALERGFDPKWFRFPWFDDLRELPELRELLAQGSGAPDSEAEKAEAPDSETAR